MKKTKSHYQPLKFCLGGSSFSSESMISCSSSSSLQHRYHFCGDLSFTTFEDYFSYFEPRQVDKQNAVGKKQVALHKQLSDLSPMCEESNNKKHSNSTKKKTGFQTLHHILN